MLRKVFFKAKPLGMGLSSQLAREPPDVGQHHCSLQRYFWGLQCSCPLLWKRSSSLFYNKEARVQRLTRTEGWMPLASLPRGVQVGVLGRITEHDREMQVETEGLGAAHVR